MFISYFVPLSAALQSYVCREKELVLKRVRSDCLYFITNVKGSLTTMRIHLWYFPRKDRFRGNIFGYVSPKSNIPRNKWHKNVFSKYLLTLNLQPPLLRVRGVGGGHSFWLLPWRDVTMSSTSCSTSLPMLAKAPFVTKEPNGAGRTGSGTFGGSVTSSCCKSSIYA